MKTVELIASHRKREDYDHGSLEKYVNTPSVLTSPCTLGALGADLWLLDAETETHVYIHPLLYQPHTPKNSCWNFCLYVKNDVGCCYGLEQEVPKDLTLMGRAVGRQLSHEVDISDFLLGNGVCSEEVAMDGVTWKGISFSPALPFSVCWLPEHEKFSFIPALPSCLLCLGVNQP